MEERWTEGSGSGRGQRGTLERRRSSRVKEEEIASMEEMDMGDAGQMNWDTAR